MKHIFSPYRACPIGAHVDHQHGIVTGVAIDMGVDLWYEPTDDGEIYMRSNIFEDAVEFSVRTPSQIKKNDWGDYLRGAKYAIRKRFSIQRGIKGHISGSLPIGGLSSSAAVLVAYVIALADANGINLQPMEIVHIASEAEREYIGLNNGILDQACIVLGQKSNLLVLDCDTEEYHHIPYHGEDFKIGVFFSGLSRSLIQTDYNFRVMECKSAAWYAQANEGSPIKPLEKTFLRDVSEETFQKSKHVIPTRFAKRAEHFYSEQRRVREGEAAWRSGNIEWFGKLSYESCESSIHNYECGSPELIALYQAMLSTDGIYGGRFSGAGFKGACVALCDPNKLEYIQEEVRRKYLSQYPQYSKSFEVNFCDTSNGAHFIED